MGRAPGDPVLRFPNHDALGIVVGHVPPSHNLHRASTSAHINNVYASMTFAWWNRAVSDISVQLPQSVENTSEHVQSFNLH